MINQLTHSSKSLNVTAINTWHAEQIRQALTNLQADDQQPDPACKQAAVLVPFVRQDQAWHLVFIRRAVIEGDLHSGQVAFPGGRYETQDDDLIQTAVREAFEEIGLPPAAVDIIGAAQKEVSQSGYEVLPVAGIIHQPVDFQIQPSEVDRVFTIPLQWLLDHEYTTQTLQTRTGSLDIIYFDDYDGETLWGLSARIVIQITSAIKQSVKI